MKSSLQASRRKLMYSSRWILPNFLTFHFILMLSEGLQQTSGWRTKMPFKKVQKLKSYLKTGFLSSFTYFSKQSSTPSRVNTEGYSRLSFMTSTMTLSDLVTELAQKPIFSWLQLYSLVSSKMQSKISVIILQITWNESSRLQSSPKRRITISLKWTYSQPQTSSVLWYATKAPSMRPILSWKAYLIKAPLIKSQYYRSKLSKLPFMVLMGQSLQSFQFSTSYRMGQTALVLISKTKGFPFSSISLQSICDLSRMLLLTVQYRQQLSGFCSTTLVFMIWLMVSLGCVSRYSAKVPTSINTQLIFSSLQPLSASTEQMDSFVSFSPAPLRVRQKVEGFLKWFICSFLMPSQLFCSQMLSKFGLRNMLKRKQRWIRGMEMLDVDDVYLHFSFSLMFSNVVSCDGRTQSDICAMIYLSIQGIFPKPISPWQILPSSNLLSPWCSLGILLKSGVSSKYLAERPFREKFTASLGISSLILQ